MTTHKSEHLKARKVWTSNLFDSVSLRMNKKGGRPAQIRFLSRRSCAANSPRTSNWWLATTLAAGTALGTISWPSPGASQTPPPPQGLIALYQYPGCAPSPGIHLPPCPSGALLENAAKNPAIAGLMIRVDWLDMYRPQWSGLIDWSITDAVFAQAAEYGKFVVLSFVPGFGSPNAVLMNPKVEKDMFCIPYGFVPFGAKAGQLSTLPMPWDATYQALWSNFLQQVSLRYASNPQFKMIAAAGPTSISEEMSLPGAEVPDKCTKPQIDADRTTWEKHFYTPDIYINSWDQVFGKYASFFPGQFVSLALYPGLPLAHSKSVPYPKTDTPSMVIGKGTANLPLTFAVEANGLTPDSPDSPTGSSYDLVVKSHLSKLVTGFEFATSALVRPEQQGDAADPTNALCLSLQTGLNAGVDYLEIYEDDAASLDPSVQALLQTAANQLLSPSGTSRTPLPCHIPRIPPPPCGPTLNTCQ